MYYQRVSYWHYHTKRLNSEETFLSHRWAGWLPGLKSEAPAHTLPQYQFLKCIFEFGIPEEHGGRGWVNGPDLENVWKMVAGKAPGSQLRAGFAWYSVYPRAYSRGLATLNSKPRIWMMVWSDFLTASAWVKNTVWKIEPKHCAFE